MPFEFDIFVEEENERARVLGRVRLWCERQLDGFNHFDVRWEVVEGADADVCKVACVCCESFTGTTTSFACGGKSTPFYKEGESCSNMMRHLRTKHLASKLRASPYKWCMCKCAEVDEAKSAASDQDDPMR
jgi:hypothetical protein